MKKGIGKFERENEFTGRLQYIDIRGKYVKDLSDLASLLKDWRNPQTEYFHIIYTNKSGKILAHTAITSDEVSLVEIPQNEIVYKIAQRGKRLKAFKIYAAHNHPSGDPRPSDNDISFTLRLFNDVPKFEAHIVLDHNRFCSIAKLGRIKEHEVDLGKSYEATNVEVICSNAAAKIFDAHYQNEEGKIGILVLNTQNKPVALEKVRYNPESFQQTLKEVVRKHCGSNVIIGTGENEKDTIMKMVCNNPIVLDMLVVLDDMKYHREAGMNASRVYGLQNESYRTRRVFESSHQYRSEINPQGDWDVAGKDFLQKQSAENQRLNELSRIRKTNDMESKQKIISRNR